MCPCQGWSDPGLSPTSVWSPWISAVHPSLCPVWGPSNHIHWQFPQQHKDPAERWVYQTTVPHLYSCSSSCPQNPYLEAVYLKSGVFTPLVHFIWAAEIKAFWTQVRHTGHLERVSGFMGVKRQMLTSGSWQYYSLKGLHTHSYVWKNGNYLMAEITNLDSYQNIKQLHPNVSKAGRCVVVIITHVFFKM